MLEVKKLEKIEKKIQNVEYVYDLSNASYNQKENVKRYLNEFIDKNFYKMAKIVEREEKHINTVHERGADIPEKSYVVGMVERFEFHFGATDEV